MSAPTPGPWKVFGPPEASASVISASGVTIAACAGRNIWDWIESDALLIAAAPDLLRELLQVRDAIIGPSIDRTARDRLVTVGQRMELSLDRINTALAKAGL